MAIEKTGACADEVIGSSWPTENEDAYTAYATALLNNAATAQKYAQAKQSEHDYALTEASGQALDAIAKAAGIDAAKHRGSAEYFAKAAGWAKYAATAIKAAKIAMNEAAAAHEPVHAMPTISATAASKGGKGATQKVKDADLQEKQDLVADAKGSMDSAVQAADRAVAAGDAIPTPFGGIPAIPEDANGSKTGTDWGGADTGLPADFPGASVPGGGVPAAGAGGGGETAAAPATPLPASVFAAPAAPPAAGGDPASALGASPAASPVASAGEGATGAAGMGGSPMGGMPTGMGQMPMQPPQMPQMPQGGAGAGGGLGEVAKPAADAITKLAGKDGGAGGGVPLTEQTLDKLLAAQGGEGGAGGDQLAPSDDASSDGKPGDGKGDHLGDGDHPPKKESAGTHDQVTGVRAPTDPYSASNTNPALNNPAASASHGGAPSPAAPVVTAPPVAVSAPMTELSADENVPGAPVQHAAAQVQPPTVENAGLHTHTAAAGITGPGGANPASPPAPPAAGGALGPYQALTPAPVSPPSMGGGMPMMPPMSPGAGTGMGGGGAAMIAAVPAAAGGAAVVGHRAGKGDDAAASDAPLERILSLPAEHAVADQHLAGLVTHFEKHQWAATPIAVGVFCTEPAVGGQRLYRYVVATADGLSHIPLGVSVPAGLTLPNQFAVRPSFVSDWSGNAHPGAKLAALSRDYGERVGRLVYLVSNDATAAAHPARADGVTEAVQTGPETAALVATRRASAATCPRTELAARSSTPNADAIVDVLHQLGLAWGFHDATVDDFTEARAFVWAHRWGRSRDCSPEYPAVWATYLYVEGLVAAQQGRMADAAYSATALQSVLPYQWAERVS